MRIKIPPVIILKVLLLTSIGMIGCSAFKAGSPPTGTEQALFTIQTNYVTIPVPVTNADHTVTVQTATRTNYVYANGPGIQNAQEIGTAIGNIFGVGGLVGTAIGGLGSLWGWYRSSKWRGTGASLAQSIETMRAFIQQLPNGQNYDNALTQWLMQHQQDTQTVSQVLDLLENDVNNDNAQVAAEQIKKVIASLNPSAALQTKG
jgi:hypothetical protein